MAEENTCPITNLTAERVALGDRYSYEVRSAEISYTVTGTATALILACRQNDVSSSSQETFSKLAYWVYRQNQEGVKFPKITSAVLDKINNQPFPNMTERNASYLLWVKQRTYPDLSRFIDDTDNPAGIVASCSLNGNDQAHLVHHLYNEGYLNFLDSSSIDQEAHAIKIKLTLQGLEYCEKLEADRSASDEVFVAMWFDSSLDELFEHIKAEVKKELDLSVVRIDRQEHNNKIDDEIIAHLKSCRFVVADFTCSDDGKTHRGGVYFEAGFAQGLQKNVIFTVRKDCVDGLHFDTRQYNHIVWKKQGDKFLEDKENDAKTLGQRIVHRIRAIET